jgi:hypothetical protein
VWAGLNNTHVESQLNVSKREVAYASHLVARQCKVEYVTVGEKRASSPMKTKNSKHHTQSFYARATVTLRLKTY